MATKTTAEKRTRAPQISDETLRLAVNALQDKALAVLAEAKTSGTRALDESPDAHYQSLGKLYAAQQEIEKVLAKRGGAA